MKLELQKSIDQCDWFKSWPEESISLAKQFIEQQDPDDVMDSVKEYPLLHFLSIWGDSECIHEEDSHTLVIKDFAKGSFGLFKPTEIKETWIENEVSLSFVVAEKKFSLNLTIDSDYIADEVYDIIERAIQSVHPNIELYAPVELLGQEFAFLLGNKDSIALALEKGYLIKDEFAEMLKEFENEEQVIADGEGEYDEEQVEFHVLMTLAEDANPVFERVYYGDLNAVKTFLANGGDINIKDDDTGSNLAVHAVTAQYECNNKACKEIALYLVDQGIDITDYSSEGLFNVVAHYDEIDVFKTIFEKADPEDMDIEDAIAFATAESKVKMLDYLKSVRNY